jgi:hypothetical protein
VEAASRTFSNFRAQHPLASEGASWWRRYVYELGGGQPGERAHRSCDAGRHEHHLWGQSRAVTVDRVTRECPGAGPRQIDGDMEVLEVSGEGDVTGPIGYPLADR